MTRKTYTRATLLRLSLCIQNGNTKHRILTVCSELNHYQSKTLIRKAKEEHSCNPLRIQSLRTQCGKPWASTAWEQEKSHSYRICLQIPAGGSELRTNLVPSQSHSLQI